jgi:uncharacterized membrane protein YphA (DoxX/SURF4 family)
MVNDFTSRYSWLTQLLLVLLRFVIGWHLLYEGLYKLNTYSTNDPWSAAVYLQNSEGPLSESFRGFVEASDPGKIFERQAIARRWRKLSPGSDQNEQGGEGQEMSAEDRVQSDRVRLQEELLLQVDQLWKNDLRDFKWSYQLEPEQRESVLGELSYAKQQLRKKLIDGPDPAARQAFDHYVRDCTLPAGSSLTRRDSQKMADNLQVVQNLVIQSTAAYHKQLAGLLSPTQMQRQTPAIVGTIGRVNWVVMGGLIGCGACLILGLFGRLAALGAAAMLLLFYLAMPPLPGLTASAVGGAHYLYVNNNLIEAMAALVLASTPSSRWIGLDAVAMPVLGFLWRGLRRREKTTVTDSR